MPAQPGTSDGGGPIPEWEEKKVNKCPEAPFHHRLVGQNYAGNATESEILKDIYDRAHELEEEVEAGPSPSADEVDDEAKRASLPRKSVVKGYENTMIEMNPLKEKETSVEKFTRRFHSALYSKVKYWSSWLDQMEETIMKKADLKAKYELLAASPLGVPYERQDRIALLLAYEFMKAYDDTDDYRDALFWPITRKHAKKYDVVTYDDTPAMTMYARITLLGGLLYLGHSPDSKDKFGYTPLHYAVSKNYDECVYLLLRWKANPDSHDDTTKWSPLHMTAEENQGNIAELLCEHGASTNAEDEYGDKPLHYATVANSKDVIEVLLRYGADPNVRNHQDYVPLHQTSDEDVAGSLVNHGADVSIADREGNSSLHLAAFEGNEPLVSFLLEKGANAELKNEDGDTPLDYAAMSSVYSAIDCFRLIFQAAKEQLDRDHANHVWKEVMDALDKDKDEKAAHLIKTKLSKVGLHECMVNDDDDDSFQESRVNSLVEIMKENKKRHRSSENIKRTVKAVFDHSIFGEKVVVADILEVDEEGDLPSSKKFSLQGGTVISHLTKSLGLCLALADHKTLRTYVNFKWKQFAAFYYWRDLIFYLFQMIMLTFALAIAARPSVTDATLNDYHTPLDIWRAVCESFIILICVAKAFDELKEIITVGPVLYVRDWMNYVQWAALILTLMIIPFRATNHPGQWIVASLAYFAHGLKAFEYATLFRLTGSYLQVIMIIIRKDITKFLVVFGLLLLVFGGSLYFALRYDETGTTSSTDQMRLDGDGTLLHELYFSFIRTMVEATSVLPYYGNNMGFRALSVILYLFFLFSVIVVLLNVLIAQMVDTYLSVHTNAVANYIYHRCRFIARSERDIHPLTCFTRRSQGGCRTIKEVKYRHIVWPQKLFLVDHPDQSKPTQIKRRLYRTKGDMSRKYLKPFVDYKDEDKIAKLEDGVHRDHRHLQLQLRTTSAQLIEVMRTLNDIKRQISE